MEVDYLFTFKVKMYMLILLERHQQTFPIVHPKMAVNKFQQAGFFSGREAVIDLLLVLKSETSNICLIT